MTDTLDPVLVIGSAEREAAFRNLNVMSAKTIIHPAEPPYSEWFEVNYARPKGRGFLQGCSGILSRFSRMYFFTAKAEVDPTVSAK